MKWRKILYASMFLLAGHATAAAQEVAEVQQSVLTKFTAMWCVECGTWSWDLFESLEDSLAGKAVLLAAHVSDSYLENEMSLAWEANLGNSGQPSFFINQEAQDAAAANAFDQIKSKVDSIHLEAPLANVGLETIWNGDQIEIRARTLFFQNGAGAFYLGVYLVEDQVMAAQAGFSGWVAHERILRESCTTAPFGNLLASGPVPAGAEFLRSYLISPEPYDLEHLDVVGVIWRKEGSIYKLVNVWSIDAKPLISPVREALRGTDIHAVLLPNILSAGEEGSISLSLPAATRLQIRLITGDGRPLPPVFSGWLPGGAHRIPFHTANLPPGWYAIRIEAEKGGGGVLRCVVE